MRSDFQGKVVVMRISSKGGLLVILTASFRERMGNSPVPLESVFRVAKFPSKTRHQLIKLGLSILQKNHCYPLSYYRAFA